MGTSSLGFCPLSSQEERAGSSLVRLPSIETLRLPRVRRCSPSVARRARIAALVPPDQHESSQEKTVHRVDALEGGRLRVTVQRTKPLLGIAIEGGHDTSQPLPRIISIHPTGAASEAGGLEKGQLITEVQGVPTRRLKHEEVAMMIADAFYGCAERVSLLVEQGPPPLIKVDLTSDD
ncbi:uncharacterized protein LOC121837283 [Ixodes scapularis]|uniref:uncharacterized protein LOC121837283 n=1 Tax=Ixodes scapularis TaxID=6945 RepID=UPI001C37EB5C|nr:uncharacterized protein LOC121837283 [Ixodes scapularis]